MWQAGGRFENGPLSLFGKKIRSFFPFCISLNFLFTFTYNSVNCNDQILRNTYTIFYYKIELKESFKKSKRK